MITALIPRLQISEINDTKCSLNFTCENKTITHNRFLIFKEGACPWFDPELLQVYGILELGPNRANQGFFFSDLPSLDLSLTSDDKHMDL